jgi:hypothetical protein
MRHAERRPLRELDIIGGVLLIAASVLVVFALEEGGMKEGAWGSALFIGPLVIGILCWVLLSGWEVTVARLWQDSIAAIMPMRLLRNRVYVSASLSTILMGVPYFVIIFNLPLRFQVVNEKTTLSAGLGLLPMLVSTAIASMVGGVVNGKKNNAFPVLVVASLLTVIGTALLSTLSNTTVVEPKTYGFQVFIGFGFGLAVSTSAILAGLESEIRDNGEFSFQHKREKSNPNVS